MKIEELEVRVRPCPFCGGVNLDVGPAGALLVGVKCRSCRAQIKRPVSDEIVPKGLSHFNRVAYATLEAIQCWNRRK